MEEFFNLLKKLSEEFGPPGHEQRVRGVVKDLLGEAADEVRVDPLGNVIALKKGSKGSGKIMLAAHMDEIALMVSHIDKRGFIRFTPMGGWNPIILPGQRVLIQTSSGSLIRGVVGSKPPHLMKPEESKNIPQIRDLFIDIGADSRGKAEEMGVEVGSTIVIERTVERLGKSSDMVTGKAFDDRVGVADMIRAFKDADGFEPNLYAVATVQEEVGLKGARTSAYSIGPDVALALDVTAANDVPGVDEKDYVARVGGGPAIKVMDGRSGGGLIAHPAVKKMLIEAAKSEGIPYQLEVLPGGTTDASIIALTREGVPAGVVSIPTRYIHSPVEALSLRDAVNSARLVVAFTRKATASWIEEVKRGI